MKKNSLLIFVAIILFYLDLPLFIGGFMLPSATGIIFLMFFIVRHTPRPYQMRCFLALEGLLLVYLVFGIAGYDIGSFISAQQLVVGVMLFSYLIIYAEKVSDATLSDVFSFTIIIISLFSSLEYFGVLGGVSDSFRSWAYGDTSYLYQNDYRDLVLVGNVRPKVFSAEPSTHTTLLACLLICYHFVTNKAKKIVETLIVVLCVMVYFFTKSPQLLLATIIFAVFRVNWKNNTGFKLTLVLPFVVMSGVFIGLNVDLYSRFASFGDASVISSENVRLYFPLVTMIDTIVHYPLLGVGVSNKDALISVSSILSEVSRGNDVNVNVLLGSFAIPRIFIYFGVLGGGVFFLILYKTILRLSGKQFLKLSFLLLILLFSIGGFERVYFWLLLALGYRSCLSYEEYD